MAAIDWKSLSEACAPLLHLALQEDVGTGDVTTQAVFSGPQKVRGHVLCRTPTVVCGVPWAEHILRHFDPQASMQALAPEGTAVPPNTRIWQFEADVRAVLTAERTLLNFFMRLCGIAHAARRAVELLPPGSKSKIYDTRKTVPGNRLLDKAAVRTGGACNHRMGLFDAVLIKDNHVAAAGGVAQAVQRARAYVAAKHPEGMIVEVEVDTLTQLDEALAAQPDVILLDNFTHEDLVIAVQRTAGRAELEASGRVTWERLPALGSTNVDRISMGALTHTVQPADLSLEIVQ